MDYYDYSTSTYATSSDIGAVAVVIWLFVILIVMAVSILMIIAMWRIFTKAGKPGWASLVPIYNMVVMMQIVGRPEWQVVLMFLPFCPYIHLDHVTARFSKIVWQNDWFWRFDDLLPGDHEPDFGVWFKPLCWPGCAAATCLWPAAAAWVLRTAASLRTTAATGSLCSTTAAIRSTATTSCNGYPTATAGS